MDDFFYFIDLLDHTMRTRRFLGMPGVTFDVIMPPGSWIMMSALYKTKGACDVHYCCLLTLSRAEFC